MIFRTNAQAINFPVMKAKSNLLIFVLALFALTPASGQVRLKPGEANTKRILLLGATAHLGNGQVIPTSAVSFSNGKFGLVADARLIRINPAEFDTIIDVSGKHLYPGFIAFGSTIGLREISAVRPTLDDTEVGDYKPHVRSATSFNTDSRVIPTLRSNGILMAQVVPQGGTISGTSSILYLDGWNWEDALVVEDDAIHLQWAQIMSRPGWWVENARVAKNESYHANVDALYAYFSEAKAYAQNPSPEPRNLGFESMKGVFDGKKKVFIRCYEAKEIAEAIRFGEAFGLDYALVDAGQAWQVTDLLKQFDVAVVLEQTHRLPPYGHSDISQPYKTPSILAAAGIKFGITEGSNGDAFWDFRNLPYQAGKAVTYGLDPELAVASITGNLAEILGIGKRCGTLTPELEATFFLSEGDMLDMRTSNILRAWIQGQEVNLDDSQKQLYRLYMDKYGLSE